MISRVVVGRAAAILFWLCGVSSLGSLLWTATPGGQSREASVAAAVAAGAGLLTWYLPWSRWPRRASLVLVPAGFALVALQGTAASPDAPVSSVLFVLLFAWIGVALPRGTALMLLPLFAAAYLLPLLSLGQSSGLAVASAVWVGSACLLVGEMLAWLSTNERRDQVALWRARAAVGHIGAELATAADPEKLWSSIALRLSDAAGLPDCDVYRLTGGGLVCLASVYEDQPCPGYLGPRPERDMWALDEKAVLTKAPILIASPADPRLGAAEREDMRMWREQAMLIVPLVARDEVVGLIEISEIREGRTITPEQVSTVCSVSPLIALALHDADTMDALDACERRLAALLESSSAVAGSAVADAASMDDALPAEDAPHADRPVAVADAETAGGPPTEADVLPGPAQPRHPAPESAADEPAALPGFAARDGGTTIDQAEMRSRIEATRTRLKVKAFDAMIRGGAALLSRDGGEGPGPTCDEPTLDGDLEGMVDGAFSEEEY